MLIRPADAARNDDEWRQYLSAHDFGQLIAPGRGRELPVVVPTHFRFDGADEIVLHLARPNPVWAALEERPIALLSVIGPYTYIPAAWNAPVEAPPTDGVPTSYYANVQLRCEVEVVDDAAGVAGILGRQLEHFEPDGGYGTFDDDGPYARLLPAIRGIRLHITDVRAKFKVGGNRGEDQRRVGARLVERGTPMDLEAAALQVARLEDSPPDP